MVDKETLKVEWREIGGENSTATVGNIAGSRGFGGFETPRVEVEETPISNHPDTL